MLLDAQFTSILLARVNRNLDRDPVMLYSTLAPENSLTAYSAAPDEHSLRLASVWWPVGFALGIVYSVFISRRYMGKVSVRRDTQAYY
jgi:hypothetical protein